MYDGGAAADEAALAYEAILHAYFGPNGPTFDLVLLGMGSDGHTASLFPGAGNLDSPRWVIPAETDVWAVHDRITLAPKAISLAREVVFEIEGADKAGIIREIIEGDGDYPSGYVARHAQNVTWLLDKTAASQLSANYA